jgi:hypothetical protein
MQKKSVANRYPAIRCARIARARVFFPCVRLDASNISQTAVAPVKTKITPRRVLMDVEIIFRFGESRYAGEGGSGGDASAIPPSRRLSEAAAF